MNYFLFNLQIRFHYIYNMYMYLYWCFSFNLLMWPFCSRYHLLTQYPQSREEQTARKSHPQPWIPHEMFFSRVLTPPSPQPPLPLRREPISPETMQAARPIISAGGRSALEGRGCELAPITRGSSMYVREGC